MGNRNKPETFKKGYIWKKTHLDLVDKNWCILIVELYNKFNFLIGYPDFKEGCWTCFPKPFYIPLMRGRTNCCITAPFLNNFYCVSITRPNLWQWYNFILYTLWTNDIFSNKMFIKFSIQSASSYSDLFHPCRLQHNIRYFV